MNELIRYRQENIGKIFLISIDIIIDFLFHELVQLLLRISG